MSESIHRSVFRNVLSLAKRVQVIKEYELYYPKPKILALATKFNVGCSQIRNILFNQEAILKAYEESEESKKKPEEKASEKNKKGSTGKVNENNKNDMTDKSKPILPGNSEPDEDGNLSVLSLTDRIKVIHDYSYKTPRPTIRSLATKYNVSSQHISNVLFSQETIIESYKKAGYGIYTEEATMEQRHNQRQDQIQFLGMVMYEYLQRALYHSEPLDDLKFQKKAAEVKECIAITKFRPSYLWLNGFKKKYGIDDLNLKSIQKKIMFTEEKQNSLDAGEMVRFVRQNKSALLKSESELIYRLANSTLPKTLFYTGNNVVGRRPNKNKCKFTTQAVYERVDDQTLKVPAATKSRTDSSDIAVIIKEISPTKLKEYTGPHLIEEEKQILSTTRSKNSDLGCITVAGRKPSRRKVNEEDMPQNVPFSDLSEEDELLTIFQIVDDEAAASPAAYSNQSCSPPLYYINNNSQNTDLSDNTRDSITIKTEPQSAEENGNDLMETNDNPSTTYILPDHSQQLCLTANNCEETIIEVETSRFNLDDDIKPTIRFEMSEEFVVENNICSNDNLISPRLATGKRSHSDSPLPDCLHEDIKPTIIFESSEEIVMENNIRTNDSLLSPKIATSKRPRSNSPLPECLDIKPKIIFESSEEDVMENTKSVKDQQHSLLLPIGKQLCSSSALPDVLDEDIKPTIIFNKSEGFAMENNNSSNDQQLSPIIAIDKRCFYNVTLPDIDTPEDAMQLLKALEKYAVLKDNYTAISLLTHLEEAFQDPPK